MLPTFMLEILARFAPLMHRDTCNYVRALTAEGVELWRHRIGDRSPVAGAGAQGRILR
jgi:hypothetical protein